MAGKSGMSSPSVPPASAASFCSSITGGSGIVPKRSRMSAGGPGGGGPAATEAEADAASSGDSSTIFILLRTSLRPMTCVPRGGVPLVAGPKRMAGGGGCQGWPRVPLSYGRMGRGLRSPGASAPGYRSHLVHRPPGAPRQGQQVGDGDERLGQRIELRHLARGERPDAEHAPRHPRGGGIATALEERREEPATEGAAGSVHAHDSTPVSGHDRLLRLHAEAPGTHRIFMKHVEGTRRPTRRTPHETDQAAPAGRSADGNRPALRRPASGLAVHSLYVLDRRRVYRLLLAGGLLALVRLTRGYPARHSSRG